MTCLESAQTSDIDPAIKVNNFLIQRITLNTILPFLSTSLIKQLFVRSKFRLLPQIGLPKLRFTVPGSHVWFLSTNL